MIGRLDWDKARRNEGRESDIGLAWGSAGMRLIGAKFRSKCRHCRPSIAVGDQVLYDPKTKSVRCGRC